jgi:hypothetical protein
VSLLEALALWLDRCPRVVVSADEAAATYSFGLTDQQGTKRVVCCTWCASYAGPMGGCGCLRQVTDEPVNWSLPVGQTVNDHPRAIFSVASRNAYGSIWRSARPGASG